MMNNDQIDIQKQKINDLTLNLIRERYDREIETSSRLDDQARQLIGSILVVIGFLLGAGAIDLLSFNSWSSAFYFGGIAVLVTSILCDYKAIKISRFYHTPDNIVNTNDINVDTLLDEKMADPTRIPYLEIVQRNVRRISAIIRENEQRNIMKARLLAKAWMFLIPGLGLVIIFIIVSILMKPPPSPT